jgi:hypothetical protein
MKRRYELIPQMKAYEEMRVVWVPHLMNLYQPNFRSPVCNTDEYGFRYTLQGSKELSYADFQNQQGPKGLLCGGSTAFGTGATGDSHTITSNLNRDSDMTWFNFGGMGQNSTQELMRYILFGPKVDQVVLFTGVNNLMIHTLSAYFSQVYGAFFSQTVFELLNRVSTNPQYVKHLMGRAKGRVIDALWRLVPGQSDEPTLDNLPDFEIRYNQSLNILGRDLDVWAALSEKSGFSLRFMLQPILTWMPKNLSPEEEELLDIMDQGGWRRWGGQIRALNDSYTRYREDTRRICEERGILWSDFNELLPREGWLFCDRTHLTDKGQEIAAEIIASECKN